MQNKKYNQTLGKISDRKKPPYAVKYGGASLFMNFLIVYIFLISLMSRPVF